VSRRSGINAAKNDRTANKCRKSLCCGRLRGAGGFGAAEGKDRRPQAGHDVGIADRENTTGMTIIKPSASDHRSHCEADSLAWLADILSSVTNLRRVRMQSAHDFVASLNTGWGRLKQQELEKNRLENHHYTPLRFITIKETDHSRLLGELLKPNGTHGQGPRFLNSFLTMLGVYKPLQGDWTVTIGVRHIDILIRRKEPQSVIIIENKANNAEDQHGQLYRYWFQEIYRQYPDLDYDDPETWERFKIIYAPSLSISQPSDDSVNRPSDLVGAPKNFDKLPLHVDCRCFKLHFAPWLERLAGEVASLRLRVFLKLYAEIWRI
jgi:hypothetical protein